MTDNKQTSPPTTNVAPKSHKPDDAGNIVISGFVRISDPETKETILEVRE